MLGPDFATLAEPLVAAAPAQTVLLHLDTLEAALTNATPIADSGRAGDELACLFYSRRCGESCSMHTTLQAMTELSPVATVLSWQDHQSDAWPSGRLRSAGRPV